MAMDERNGQALGDSNSLDISRLKLSDVHKTS